MSAQDTNIVSAQDTNIARKTEQKVANLTPLSATYSFCRSKSFRRKLKKVRNLTRLLAKILKLLKERRF